MIKFFRHIRKSLIEKSQMGKYFKYAIGEILLVVIGILIALQINNWNEHRNNRAFENEILTQIRANLIKDKLSLIAIVNSNNKAVYSSKKILSLKPNEVTNDSIKYWLGDVIQFDRFQPLTNAYEVLKSKGLDQVSNIQLRFLLGTYYDDKAKHIQLSVDDIKYTFVNDWLPEMKKNIVDLKFKNYVALENYNDFVRPGETRNILLLNIDNYNGSTTYIKQGIAMIDKIMEILKEELE